MFFPFHQKARTGEKGLILMQTHNPPLNLTARQLRCRVPSALRAPAAG